MRRPVNERPDRLLPFVAFVDVIAFNIVAPGKPQELRMQGSELLHHVDAKTVWLILVGRRKKRNQREPYGPRMFRQKLQMIIRGSRQCPSLQRENVSLPRFSGS